MPRPHITLSYAQSLDGCLTTEAGQPTALSGPEALAYTHQLRAAHEALLVGIGTVLADDPRLTARLTPGVEVGAATVPLPGSYWRGGAVTAPGMDAETVPLPESYLRRGAVAAPGVEAETPPHRQPQPIILDSRLRTPLTARVFNHPRAPWIITNEHADAERQRQVEARGGRVVRLPVTAHGHVSLPALLDWLGASNINSMMVEGGSAVITSFLQARLVNRIAITIAPRLMGGLQAVGAACDLSLHNVRHRILGQDVMVEGEVQ